jgi:hypothetical protein
MPAPPTIQLPRPPVPPQESAASPPPVPPKPPKPPVYERPPEIIGLRDVEMIRERALEGRAARFYPQSHQIFINLTYAPVQEMAVALEHSLDASVTEEETVRRIATEIAEWCLTKRVTRALVYSLAKKALGWRPEDVMRGQSPESLSLVADDWSSMMDTARVRFQDALAAHFPDSPVLRTVAA